MRAIRSDPGTAATANIASGSPINSPTCVSDMCSSFVHQRYHWRHDQERHAHGDAGEPQQAQELDEAADRRAGGVIDGLQHRVTGVFRDGSF